MAPKTFPPFKLEPAEIAFVARAAGVRPSQIGTAVAIALSESGGNMYALNNSGRDESYGLWQINMQGGLGPDRRNRFHITDNEALYDPFLNAQAMDNISSGGFDWSPWSVYKSGAYFVNLPRGIAAANAPLDPTPRLNADINSRKAADASPLASITNWIQMEMLRVAGFVGGGFLLIIGIYLYVRSRK